MKTYAILILLVCFDCLAVKGQVREDTFSVYFPSNSSLVARVQQTRLDSLKQKQALPPAADVQIVGYADYVGSEEYNKKLSEDRALSVKKQALRLGYKEEQIRVCIGKGEVERAVAANAKGYAPDRKVDIIVLPAGTHKKREEEALKAAQNGGTAELKKYLKDLLTLPVKEAILLQHVHFMANSHETTADSKAELNELYQVLKENPSMMIRIEGHICCVTDFPDALDETAGDHLLSVNRAKYIYQYLVNKGIESSRLSYMGFGRRKPVVLQEVTDTDKDKNRRVEIRLLAK